jgi:hypothetical protein
MYLETLCMNIPPSHDGEFKRQAIAALGVLVSSLNTIVHTHTYGQSVQYFDAETQLEACMVYLKAVTILELTHGCAGENFTVEHLANKILELCAPDRSLYVCGGVRWAGEAAALCAQIVCR